MRRSLAALALCLWTSVATAWTPPPDADAREVLREAEVDAKLGRLEDASAKHRWFHENADRFGSLQSSYRLSMALERWIAVARRHPPAMAEVLAARERARLLIASDTKLAWSAFVEVYSFDKNLKDWESTHQAYTALTEAQPSIASRALDLALPALLARGATELAAKHLDADLSMRVLEVRHSMMMNAAGGMDRSLKRVQRRFVQGTELEGSRIVYVLQHAGQNEKAGAVADRLRKLLGPDASLSNTEAALKGKVPPTELD